MLNFLNSVKLFVLDTIPDNKVIDPLYQGISSIGPVVLSVVLALSLFYGVFLGVKYAKCEDASQKANVQKTLVNFIIGAVTVWILLAVLYAIRGPLASWLNS